MNIAQENKVVNRVRLITGGTGTTKKKDTTTLYFKEGFFDWQKVKQAFYKYFTFIRDDENYFYFNDNSTDSRIALRKFKRNDKNLVKIAFKQYSLGGLLSKDYSFNDLFK